MEYEHLAGGAGEAAGTPAPADGLRRHGDMPADWARPWGAGPMVEMGTAYAFYREQRDRLARWLPTAGRGSGAAAADAQLARIVSRFESAKGGRDLWLEPRSELASRRTWPWANLRFAKWAAGVAVVVAAIGTAGILAGTRGSDSLGAVSAPSRAVVAVPEAVAAVNERPREPRSAGGSDDQSKAPEHKARESVNPTELATSETPRPDKPEPAPEVAPTPADTSATTPAPVPSSDPQPDPQQDPDPGPVSSLPPPVGSLPPPDDSGAGGG